MERHTTTRNVPEVGLALDQHLTHHGKENGHVVQSVFSTLSQGLEDLILESSLGRWPDTVATYCPGRPTQIAMKSMTKHGDRVEKTLCMYF